MAQEAMKEAAMRALSMIGDMSLDDIKAVTIHTQAPQPMMAGDMAPPEEMVEETVEEEEVVEEPGAADFPTAETLAGALEGMGEEGMEEGDEEVEVDEEEEEEEEED